MQIDRNFFLKIDRNDLIVSFDQSFDDNYYREDILDIESAKLSRYYLYV